MTEIEQARKVLETNAMPALLKTIDQLVANGQAEWKLDPEVRGVVGVVAKGTNRALVVIYVTDQDFEVANELELTLTATR